MLTEELKNQDPSSELDKNNGTFEVGTTQRPTDAIVVPEEFPQLDSKDVAASSTGKLRCIRNYIEIGYPGTDYNPLHTVSKANVIPVCQLNDEMRIPLEYLQAFVDSSGNRYLIEKDNPSHLIRSSREIKAALMEHDIIFHFMPGMGLDFGTYMEGLLREAQVIDRFSMTPEYNRDQTTFYIGDGKRYHESDACQRNGSFRRLMSTFTTASLKDEYRLAAGLLSPFLSRNLDARRPLFGIVAPSRSAGKTTAVTMGARIIQGQDPLLMQGDSGDGCVNNGLSTIGNRFVLIDNLVKPSISRLTKLSTQVTNPNIKAWFFMTAHLRVPNNKVYFATFNGEESFNADFLARLLLIRLKDRKALSEAEHLQVMKQLDEFYMKRNEVISDIMAGIAVVHEHHDQEAAYKVAAPEKFGQWAEEVAKLLHTFYPEVDCFDFSLSEEDKEYDAELEAIALLPAVLFAKYGLELPNRKFELSQLAPLVNQLQVRMGQHPTLNLRSLAQRMSLLEEIPGYRVLITAGRARKRYFQFEKIDEPEDEVLAKASGE